MLRRIPLFALFLGSTRRLSLCNVVFTFLFSLGRKYGRKDPHLDLALVSLDRTCHPLGCRILFYEVCLMYLFWEVSHG